MRKSKHSEEQIAFALRQAEAGMPVVSLVRNLGVTEQTFYRWKKKSGSIGI
jgi:putative transposase